MIESNRYFLLDWGKRGEDSLFCFAPQEKTQVITVSSLTFTGWIERPVLDL